MNEPAGPGDDAISSVSTGPDAEPGRLLHTLEVDGEIFAVRSRGGGTDYDWVSGPNKDYGFSSSGGVDDPREAHRESIRAFLGMIDPSTGYIEED